MSKTTKDGIRRLELNRLEPNILSAYYFAPPPLSRPGQRMERRRVTDYELEYILDSSGAQEIDGKTYQLHPGDLVLRYPGQTTQGILPYRCYCVILDLWGEGEPIADYWKQGHRRAQALFSHPLIEGLPPVISPLNGEAYRATMEHIIKAFSQPEESARLLLKSLLFGLFYRLIQELEPGAAEPEAACLGPEANGISDQLRERLRRGRAWIWANHKNQVKLAGMAAAAGLSAAYFHRGFSRLYGISPAEYLYRLRYGSARELLISTDLSLRIVAKECGFANPGYFYRFFKKRGGLSPGAFRQLHRLPQA